jgi:hypothetical protein
MITTLPEYWYIPITEESLTYINRYRASGRAHSENPFSLDKGKYLHYKYLSCDKEAIGQGRLQTLDYQVELTLKEFRKLVLKDTIQERIKLFKI